MVPPSPFEPDPDDHEPDAPGGFPTRTSIGRVGPRPKRIGNRTRPPDRPALKEGVRMYRPPLWGGVLPITLPRSHDPFVAVLHGYRRRSLDLSEERGV